MHIAKKNVVFVSVIFLFVICILMACILTSWIHPVKYAVQEEDFSDYSEYILVREVHYTGTGWSCIAEYQGKKEHKAFAEELDCYVIKDWYPVYPVVRNGRLLPQFCYPRGYMTEKDVKSY